MYIKYISAYMHRCTPNDVKIICDMCCQILSRIEIFMINNSTIIYIHIIWYIYMYIYIYNKYIYIYVYNYYDIYYYDTYIYLKAIKNVA